MQKHGFFINYKIMSPLSFWRIFESLVGSQSTFWRKVFFFLTQYILLHSPATFQQGRTLAFFFFVKFMLSIKQYRSKCVFFSNFLCSEIHPVMRFGSICQWIEQKKKRNKQQQKLFGWKERALGMFTCGFDGIELIGVHGPLLFSFCCRFLFFGWAVSFWSCFHSLARWRRF